MGKPVSNPYGNDPGFRATYDPYAEEEQTDLQESEKEHKIKKRMKIAGWLIFAAFLILFIVIMWMPK